MVTIPHPVLISVVVLVLAIPVARWLANRASLALREHDAALDRVDYQRIAASAGPDCATLDPLVQIESLLDEEVALIHVIVSERSSGEHVSPEHIAALRQIHRQGMAVRQRCGDSALNAELAWLQGFGSFALLADLSETDSTRLERELNFRAAEVRRALDLRRSK